MSTALVTGASSGLGAQYARQLAQRGFDLVLVARDEQTLISLADELAATGRQVEVLSADLSDRAALATVEARVADVDRPIDVLVNNAGSGTRGNYVGGDLDEQQRMHDLNTTAVMRLCHAALPAMIARGHGDVINVSSVAAYVPGDAGAAYGATKAYILALTEALAVNLDGTGVHISAVCPGFVPTKFHPRVGMDTGFIPKFAWLRADDVVRESLAKHFAGRTTVVPSALYKAIVAATKVVPRAALRRTAVRARSFQ